MTIPGEPSAPLAGESVDALPSWAAGVKPARGPRGIDEIHVGGYAVRFARDETDLDAVFRLRFEVFNLELGEGLEESWNTGRDEDAFDRVCHHLMLVETRTGCLVGTYRMQTFEMARKGVGFYCDDEFDLSAIPEDVLSRSIELGRACIRKDHRNGTALFALWRGLAAYLTWSEKHLLFGCCSLTSQDPADGAAMLQKLERMGRVSDTLRVSPRADYACALDATELPAVKTPPLFGTYLRYGAVACGPPALDRFFKTIDFFLVVDSNRVEPRLREMFFADLPVSGRAKDEGIG